MISPVSGMGGVMSSLQLQHWVIYPGEVWKRSRPWGNRRGGVHLMFCLSKVFGLGRGILIGCTKDSSLAIQLQDLIG